MPVTRAVATAVAAIATLLLAACAAPEPPLSDGTAIVVAAPEAAAAAPVAGASGVLEIGGRPVDVQVPPSDGAAGTGDTAAMPLLVLLHGFTSSAARVDGQLGLREQAAARGVLYAVPEGTADGDGNRFWDASDACCGKDRGAVDDVAYLTLVMHTLEATYAVDPDRVAVVGYSNGGFMAYRLACDGDGLVSVAVSLSGAMPADAAGCRPPAPVTVVQAHGTDDQVISATGGFRDGHPYPSAAESAADWARLDGCSVGPELAGPIDLDVEIEGAETSVATWSGCSDGTRVELWTIDGAGHAPSVGNAFATSVLDVVTGTTTRAPARTGSSTPTGAR